jgi:VWFA-related protein
VCFGLVFLKLWLTPFFAQTAGQASPEGVIRITVNLVQVDAVVTDSRGHQVTDLGPADFEILEDGRPQTITNFSYIFTTKPPGTEAHAAPAPAMKGIPSVPPARLLPEQVRRSMVILVDDLHISFENLVYVRKALNKYIDHDVQPGDLVAILHTSSGVGVRQQFTNDRRVLHAEVDRLRYYILYGEPTNPTGTGQNVRRGTGEPGGVSRDFEAAASDFRQAATGAGTADALIYVLGGLRNLPGRKAVFLVSEGFRLCTAWDSQCTPEIEERRLREIADLANRSATVIYAMGAQGLPTLSLDIASDGPPDALNPQQWYMDTLNGMHSAYFQQQGPLAFLANATEGLFIHDYNDLAGGMHEMINDLGGYYLIGYKPSADTFQANNAGRSYHHIQVKLKVPGLHVRSRPGFFGIPDRETRPVYRTREDQLKAAALSPFGASDLRVELALQFENKGGHSSAARLWGHIDAQDLTFHNAPDGSKKGATDLMVLAFGDNGAVAGEFDGRLKYCFRPPQFQEVHQDGVNFRLELSLKGPGGYQVRAAVRDPDSQKLGSASQFIEIPNLRPDRLALSGIVLNAKVLGEKGPAARRFKAGDRVSYELEIYNTRRASAAGAPNLENRIQIFRDGRRVSAQNPGTIRQDSGDSKRLVMSGELALAPGLAPGDYVLLVTITDNLAPRKHAAARQWIDFEVVP